MLILFSAVSFLVIFGAQYFLLRMPRLRFLRHLPWAWVVAVLIFAVTGLFGDTGGWIDLRSFFALIFCGYAAICAAGIGLAHLVIKRKSR